MYTITLHSLNDNSIIVLNDVRGFIEVNNILYIDINHDNEQRSFEGFEIIEIKENKMNVDV